MAVDRTPSISAMQHLNEASLQRSVATDNDTYKMMVLRLQGFATEDDLDHSFLEMALK